MALFGLVMMLPVGVGLLRGDLSLDEAGIRVAVLLVVLAVVDRVVVPVARGLVGTPANRRPTGDEGDGPGAGDTLGRAA